MKLLIFILILITNLVYANYQNPSNFINNIIDECKPALKKENADFLEKTMEKYIDFNEISIWIAGKKIWLDTSKDKKDLFIKELKKLMLKTYSKTVYYYIDADVEFIPTKTINNNEQSKRVQISSIMKKNNKNVSIIYRLIKNDNSWLVFDVIIEGISILKSLKTQYSEIIRLYGLDNAIKKIQISNEL